jgi:hypothetical protein
MSHRSDRFGSLTSPSPFGATPNAERSTQVGDLHQELDTTHTQVQADVARLQTQVKDLATLRNKVELLETKVDGLKEAAGEIFPSAKSNHDDEGDEEHGEEDVEEHREENENDGANTLMLSADRALMTLLYEQFPQHQGKSLNTICEQAVQEGAQATPSLVSSSRPSTKTRASQRTQGSTKAKAKKFFVQLKLWTIDRAGTRFFGGREIMNIMDNSTLRDLEIQIENHIKEIQEGDISKRANLKDPSVFYWSTEHVVENIKAMRNMDADENTWCGADEAVIISKENVKGIIDWLKREKEMPWLSVTIKLKDASER